VLRPDPNALADHIGTAADRFAAALEAAPDPAARAGTLSWTVHQLAAHLGTGIPGYLAMLRGDATHLTDLSQREAAGAAAMAAEVGTPIGELAERVRSGSAAFAELLRSKAPDDPVPFYDRQQPASVVGALLLAELLVHGHDLGLPVPADAAALAGPPALEILPMLVKPGTPRRAALAFRLRGHGEAVVEVDEDAARLQPAGTTHDVRLSAEPVTFLLACYGRVSPLRPMLTGKLSVTGRRPWRLGALRSRFETA
jgi:uncharacterized protein (TIGR03083 family)